eukprot:TRINITY_DN14622_c0_g1_i1.p2 TRINITY_DN14622_c0_g1~~TRINITY_DN14622_c0_g1_i1.p2  ORF type:complete len:107 (-),score=23.04 TRINITY_DN14622_c0_g1_i1:5-325(-)
MNKIALATVAALAGSAMAGSSLNIDVSGVNSWGFQGDAQNEFVNVFVGAGATITSIAWDVNLTTVVPSWADETRKELRKRKKKKKRREKKKKRKEELDQTDNNEGK